MCCYLHAIMDFLYEFSPQCVYNSFHRYNCSHQLGITLSKGHSNLYLHYTSTPSHPHPITTLTSILCVTVSSMKQVVLLASHSCLSSTRHMQRMLSSLTVMVSRSPRSQLPPGERERGREGILSAGKNLHKLACSLAAKPFSFLQKKGEGSSRTCTELVLH